MNSVLKIAICFIFSFLPFFQWPNTYVSAQTNVTVNVPILNVREGPGLSYDVKMQVKHGEQFQILDKENDWVKIQLTNKQIGWVSRTFITMDSELDTQNKKKQHQSKEKVTTGTITATVLNVRSQGSLSGDIIGKVEKGEQVKILKETNNWSNIIFDDQTEGWVASWFVDHTNTNSTQTKQTNEDKKQTAHANILYDGTNIRIEPSISADVLQRSNEGDSFNILSTEGEWYKLQLPHNQVGYVAGWIVESTNAASKIEHSGIDKYLKGKTIVLDPGHGGIDSGAIGDNGTFEKDITLRTAKLVYDKLQSAGANVVLTRSDDYYITLQDRVSTSHYYNADAFISIHCDSINQPNIRGTATYYYNSNDTQLARDVQEELIKNTGFPDRHIQFGDYQVIRENNQPAVLIELGFLSNKVDQLSLLSSSYQSKAANAIVDGVAQYLK